FGETEKSARKTYIEYVNAGIGQGRREELTGGGLVRSAGGWSEIKELRRQGQDHVMSDERILGDSKFVESLLLQAAEKYERRYELKRHGYDLDRIAERVGEIYGMEPREILSRGKQQRKVKARSLCCYWAVSELGMSLRELARRLEMSPPAVGFSVERGEAIAHENGYRLIN
ncbi:MAG: transposase, partial [Deltaproteobacteria bacterium]|nr:transposase [Deltaproteobacteria bacterium]